MICPPPAVVRLNPTVWAAQDKVVQLQYIFDTLGFDCLWTATLLQPDRLPYMNFMQVPQTCGATRSDAIRCDPIRCDAMRCDAMRSDAVRCGPMQDDEILYRHTHAFRHCRKEQCTKSNLNPEP